MAFQGDSIFWVEVEKIVPNPFQPRREFDQNKLKELAESVRMYGILQPLTVTRKEIQLENGAFRAEYELIAGERRLRASKLAGLQQVPVIIRDGEQTEQEKLELAIIENLQREDLNAVDRALAFKQLAEAFKLSHAQVAAKVGRSREYVSNSIRLLNLPDRMLDSLRMGDISEGHARTLLMLNDRPEEQDTVYREIMLKKLSVREVERITRKIAVDKVRKKDWKNSDPELIEIEKELTETLGTRVQIAKTDYGGKVTIDYFSADDLEKLLGYIKRGEQTGLAAAVGAVGVADLARVGLETVSDSVPEEDKTPEWEDEGRQLQEDTWPQVTPEPASRPETESTEPALPENSPVVESSPAEPVSEPVAPQADAQPVPPEEPVQERNTQAFITPEAVKEKEEDDSGLYSIGNFGI